MYKKDKRIKNLEFYEHIIDGKTHSVIKVNNRYEIYDDNVIYDNVAAKDIPSYIFDFQKKLCRFYTF